MKTNKNFDNEEWQNRLDLAAAYHLADIYGFSDIIWNHITCKTSSKKNTFLINKTPAIQFGRGGRSKYRNRKNIDYQQYELLKERAKLPILVSVVDSRGERSVRYKNKLVNQTVDITGGDENALRTLNTFIDDGRGLTQDDIRFSRNVCLLGMDVIDRLFPFEDPLGKVIQIKGLNYTVVGTVQRKGELFGGSQDNFILIPITCLLYTSPSPRDLSTSRMPSSA